MMFCPACGTKLQEGMSFCPGCGAAATAISPQGQQPQQFSHQPHPFQQPAPPQPVVRQKKTGKHALIIALLVLALIAIALGAFFLVRNTPARRCQRQIDLGNRYLSELQYEDAVTAFEAALAIDPKNEDAYIGLASVYRDTQDMEALTELAARAEENLPAADYERVKSVITDAVVAFVEELTSAEKWQEAEDVLNQSMQQMDQDILRRKQEDIAEQLRIIRQQAEESLWEKLRAVSPNGEVYAFACDDYDKDGTYEAFAVLGFPTQGPVSDVDVVNGNVWFADKLQCFQVTDHEPENYRFSQYWTEIANVMDLGEALFYVPELLWGAVSSSSEMFGVRDGNPYETVVSGHGGGIRTYGDPGDFVMTIDPYDAPWHSHRDYFFYYEAGEIKEYGAIYISEQQLLGKVPGAKIYLDKIRNDGYEIVSILYRLNGIIHINYQRLGATELESEFLNYALLLDQGELTDLSDRTYEEGETWLMFSGGHYVPALIPEIAVYPDDF